MNNADSIVAARTSMWSGGRNAHHAGQDRAAVRSVLRKGAGMAAILALALSAAACSLSFPMSSMTSDDAPVSAINQPAAALSPELDAEDWRRAKAALSTALDPQGNGSVVAWKNPQSGAKGSFVAVAAPFIDNDRICRKFDARLSATLKPMRRLAGSACRNRDGEWVLNEVQDQKGA